MSIDTKPIASGDNPCRDKSAVVLLQAKAKTTEHEQHAQHALGIKVAKLLGCPFLGNYEAKAPVPSNLYYIPTDTLIGRDKYKLLGIDSRDDFFGGLVSHPFMATKAITHPLFGANAQRPIGWPLGFAQQTNDAVLRGYTVFDLDEALQAGNQLLRNGPLRVKPVRATAGRGQIRITTPKELATTLAALNQEEVASWGLVLEEDLIDVSTYSVGQVTLGGITVSYFGTQQLTHDNTGEQVYGGSDLRLVRGGYEQLLQLQPAAHIRLAIRQAQTYEQAAFATLPDFIASRRNYDVAQGLDAQGRQRSGVLEQSWRIGGASGAEILALLTLAEAPSLHCIRASTHEIYGDATPPLHASVLYQGDDPEVGRISKFAVVEPYVP